jgi:hypothetical protein
VARRRRCIRYVSDDSRCCLLLRATPRNHHGRSQLRDGSAAVHWSEALRHRSAPAKHRACVFRLEGASPPIRRIVMGNLTPRPNTQHFLIGEKSRLPSHLGFRADGLGRRTYELGGRRTLAVRIKRSTFEFGRHELSIRRGACEIADDRGRIFTAN